jgi:dihydrofolate synthase/folylpolyglutamate synthase
VAHNPAGAWALRSALSERYEERSLIFVFGALRDKAIAEMTEILFPIAERVVAASPNNPRAATAEEIRSAAVRTGAEIEVAESVPQALDRARQIGQDQGSVIVVTGSIYLVGAAMSYLGARV